MTKRQEPIFCRHYRIGLCYLGHNYDFQQTVCGLFRVHIL